MPRVRSAPNGGSDESWPFTTYSSFLYRSSSMQDCAKARALADYLYWTQTNPVARQISERYASVALSRLADPRQF